MSSLKYAIEKDVALDITITTPDDITLYFSYKLDEYEHDIMIPVYRLLKGDSESEEEQVSGHAAQRP